MAFSNVKENWEFVCDLGTDEKLFKVREARHTRYVSTNGVTERWYDNDREAHDQHACIPPTLGK
jgi:hypothetical protein